MIAESVVKKERFRPHHIFCERFLRLELPERGEKYGQVSRKRKDVIEDQDDVIIEVIEGIDQLCRMCPECQDGRCQNPRGGEEAVRKWDAIILKGLEINYGEARTSKDWRILINQKAPLNFCKTRCQYRSNCNVFHLL